MKIIRSIFSKPLLDTSLTIIIFSLRAKIMGKPKKIILEEGD